MWRRLEKLDPCACSRLVPQRAWNQKHWQADCKDARGDHAVSLRLSCEQGADGKAAGPCKISIRRYVDWMWRPEERFFLASPAAAKRRAAELLEDRRRQMSGCEKGLAGCSCRRRR